MSNKFEIKLVLEGLNCANCANKIEHRVSKLEGVKEATINFSTSVLIVNYNSEKDKKDCHFGSLLKFNLILLIQ